MNLVTEEAVQGSVVSLESFDLTVADAVWIAAADLQRKHENPNWPLATEEIVKHVQELHLTKGTEKTIWQHVNQHCVANRKPQPNRARMLYALGRGDRRLFRDGDRFDSERADAPTHPTWEKLPAKFTYLREWYEKVWNVATKPAQSEDDPLLSLIGVGRGMWNGLSPDDYVASLREGWEDRQ